MSESKQDFERSFRKLTEKIESQANDRSIIRYQISLQIVSVN